MKEEPHYREIGRELYHQTPQFRKIHREQNKRYYQNHKTEIKNRQNKKALEAKKIVVDHYGGQCACCGETELVFLTVDHINNDGKEDRKRNYVGAMLYRKLIREGFPEGYQVLCWNCNWAKSHGGCPHKKEKCLLDTELTIEQEQRELLQI